MPPSSVSNNVFLSGNDIGSEPRGFAIDVNPFAGHLAKITNNIIAHKESSRPGRGISLNRGTAGFVVTHNIIYKWDNPLLNDGKGNIISENEINLTGYRDADRTIETYNASLGGAPKLSDFLREARKQSKDNWRPQYTAKSVNEYIRAGFERK